MISLWNTASLLCGVEAIHTPYGVSLHYCLQGTQLGQETESVPV